jgi:hypothetical protein
MDAQPTPDICFSRLSPGARGWQDATSIDILPFQPLPVQPVVQRRFLVQRFEFHIIEINMLAQVLKQRRKE